MPRANPESSGHVSVTTITGRTGGSFGNYENKVTHYVDSAGVSQFYRTYSSTSTPNFFSSARFAPLPFHGYVSEVTRVTNDRGYTHRGLSYDGWTYYSSVSSCASFYSFTPLQLGLDYKRIETENKAIMRLGQKASGVRVNLAQMMGERKQTAELLASTANRIYQSARALRRGDLSGFTRSLSLSGTEARSAKSAWKRVEKTPPDKRIASHWLEFVYGWRPLLSDVFDSAEFMAQQAAKSADRVNGTITASARGFVKYSGSEMNSLMGHTNTWGGYESEYKVRYTAQYRLESQARQLLAQTGITNPMLLAWELLPYSFVVDWFVPVGTYLESLTAFDGFDLVTDRSFVNTKLKVVYTLNYNASGAEAGRPWSTSGGCSKESFRFSRGALQFWPSYTLKTKSPIGGAPLERFLTAASLMRVLFR